MCPHACAARRHLGVVVVLGFDVLASGTYFRVMDFGPNASHNGQNSKWIHLCKIATLRTGARLCEDGEEQVVVVAAAHVLGGVACARAAAAYAGALFALAAPNMHVEALLTRPWRNSTDCCWGRCRREGNWCLADSALLARGSAGANPHPKTLTGAADTRGEARGAAVRARGAGGGAEGGER